MSIHLPNLPAGLPDWAVPAAGVSAVAVFAFGAWLAARRSHAAVPPAATAAEAVKAATEATMRRWRAVVTLLTIGAATIATATSLNGMWHVFGDALGLDGPGRITVMGFLEIALMVSAIRAKLAILERRPPGVDGAAVWVLALCSAALSAADASSGLARALRFLAPLVAAYMWDRGLAADRHRANQTTDGAPAPVGREAIAWRFTRARLAVWAGLADPAQRTGTDVDRARRLARLTRARLRLAVLESTALPWPLAWATLRPVRAALAGWRLQRQALTAVEHLRLGDDPSVTVTIRSTVAAVVGLRAATAAAALTHVDPWHTSARQLPPALHTQLGTGQDTGRDTAGQASAPAEPDTSTTPANGTPGGPAVTCRVSTPDAPPPVGNRCEACGLAPATLEWARRDAGAPFRLCATCTPTADTSVARTVPTTEARVTTGPVTQAATGRAARPRGTTGAGRVGGGSAGGNDTAARVARLHRAHPQWTPQQLAARLGVTDRTVRRYLNPTTRPATTGPTTADGDDTSQAA